MSIIDKALAAITPLASAKQQAEATGNARAETRPGDWLSLALDHHALIREAFAVGSRATNAAERVSARQALAVVLNGHSLAEELVLYPALAQAGKKAHAAQAYIEQTTAKNQMAELENIAASKPEWKDKWEHIEGAVLTHMYEEESSWFLELKEKGENQQRLTARYLEEYTRYVDGPQAVA